MPSQAKPLRSMSGFIDRVGRGKAKGPITRMKDLPPREAFAGGNWTLLGNGTFSCRRLVRSHDWALARVAQTEGLLAEREAEVYSAVACNVLKVDDPPYQKPKQQGAGKERLMHDPGSFKLNNVSGKKRAALAAASDKAETAATKKAKAAQEQAAKVAAQQELETQWERCGVACQCDNPAQCPMKGWTKCPGCNRILAHTCRRRECKPAGPTLAPSAALLLMPAAEITDDTSGSHS